MKKQSGALLVEVMVSMGIGIFLMYGALQVLLTTKRNYLARDGMSVVEQNGRLALDMMASDIRMAGYRGCSAADNSISVGVSLSGYYTNAVLDPDIGIRGWEYLNTGISNTLTPANWVSTGSFNGASWLTGGVDESEKVSAGKDLTGSMDFDIAQESDVLRLWSVIPYVMDVSGISSTQITPVVDTMDGFPTGANDHLVIVSDCERSLLAKAVNFTSSAVTLDDTVDDVVSAFSSMSFGQMMMLNMVQYSLEIPAERDRPSLYRRELNADGEFKNKVELMPGVLNMQILYGENLDGDMDADAYLTADNVSNWKNVVSVRLWMLVETENDRVIPNSRAVNYYGNTYSINDRRVRREFSTTVTLRNRMLGE